MSINKIKELRDRTNVEFGDYDDILTYLDTIATYLIAQHEEKKKYTETEVKQVQNNVMSNVVDRMINECKRKANDQVVEVGQIWRINDELYEVVRLENKEPGIATYRKAELVNSNGKKEYYTHRDLSEYRELVTMENIKHGEWIEALNDYEHEYQCGMPSEIIRKGDKLEVFDTLYGFVRIKNKYNYVRPVSTCSFKPCLPPVEEQPKLYTQEELDKAVKDAEQKGYNDMKQIITNVLGIEFD